MRRLEFDPVAFEDLAWWVEKDRRQALRIMRLIEAVQRDPFQGPGQPEPLRHELAGCWSRRGAQAAPAQGRRTAQRGQAGGAGRA